MINRLRRCLVTLCAAWGLLACVSPQQPAAPSANARLSADARCNAQPEPGQPQYIVGYGSLMQDESRKRTSPQAGPAYPVEVAGYKRGWFEAGGLQHHIFGRAARPA